MIRFLTALLFLGVLLGVVTAVAIIFFCFKRPASDTTFRNPNQIESGGSISHTTHHVGI